MNSVDRKQLKERCANNDVKPLADKYDLEEAAFAIKECTHKIDIQKGYKKKKNQDISDEIAVLQNKIDYYKKVIVATLEKEGEKNINLTGACKLSLRKTRAKWVIDDEESLLKVLEDTDEIKNCAKKIDGWKTDKKKIDKILNDWEKSESLPPSVHKELGETGVSISFVEKDEDVPDKPVDTTVPIKDEDYDDLEW